jgi:hypothetical protein
MSIEHNAVIGRRVMDEVVNQGRLDLVDELFTPDYVSHDPAHPQGTARPHGTVRCAGVLRHA